MKERERTTIASNTTFATNINLAFMNKKTLEE